MPDLTAFLLARISEDEETAKRAAVEPWYSQDWTEISGAQLEHAQLWDPARVLAECETKTAIIRYQQHATGSEAEAWTDALRLLAAVYKDHPDYQPEWELRA